MSEPTKADRERANTMLSREARLEDVEVVARALADERERLRAQIIAALREDWDEQCAGFTSLGCESCRAYTDAIRAVEVTA